MSATDSSAPLSGITVIEFEGIGPGPLACKMLSDLGCEVIRISRPSHHSRALPDVVSDVGVAARTIFELDLKTSEGLKTASDLVADADVLLEAFRPGVMERLGLGPDTLCGSNPSLVYARLTGWGQTGPYAEMAGHDINYIGVTGALDAIGTQDSPVPPLNLVGDYAGGSMHAVLSILAALVERTTTGLGTVLDIAMVDGVNILVSPIAELVERGVWVEQRSSNLLDGGAPFYRTYRTSDGRFMAVGALEPAFYTEFVSGLGLDESVLPDRMNKSNWPALAEEFAAVFLTRDRDHWQSVFDGTDACVTPVLTISESSSHPQNARRNHTKGTDNASRLGGRRLLGTDPT